MITRILDLLFHRRDIVNCDRDVYLRRGFVSAWFVFEGAEDPNYSPVCYSNQDLSKFYSGNLYQDMSARQIKRLLKSVNLL